MKKFDRIAAAAQAQLMFAAPARLKGLGVRYRVTVCDVGPQMKISPVIGGWAFSPHTFPFDVKQSHAGQVELAGRVVNAQFAGVAA